MRTKTAHIKRNFHIINTLPLYLSYKYCIAHHSPFNDNNNSWHFIVSVVFCACFFDRLQHWIIIVSLKNVHYAAGNWRCREKSYIKIGCCFFFVYLFCILPNDTYASRLDGVFCCFQHGVRKFMAKMIYLNVFTTILHLLLCVCVSVVFIIIFFNFLHRIELRICFAGTVDYSYR